MADAPNILFAGGGTGGHVYPAIAIADAIRRHMPAASIAFAGTRDRMEWEAVPKAGYDIYPITVSGLHRNQPLRNVSLPYKLARSLVESRTLVRKLDPDVAVGTGGYVSGPVLFAASLAGTPLVLQEQNAYAGLTNRLLGRRATRIHVAFLEAKKYLPADRCVLSGNPTRMELLACDAAEGRAHYGVPPDAFVLAVLGGSLGSRAINEAVAHGIETVLRDESTHVLWQSGRQYFEALRARVPEHPRLRLLEYIDHMDLTYAAADLAVCRAGAITCSELMVTGTPSILVPSPNVAEDHQTYNARSMAGAGAAVMISEDDMKDRLLATVSELRNAPARLAEMSRAARQIARPEAADTIARDVLQVAGFDEEVPSDDGPASTD
jgi:UDP-N-acetylglucosamine--N-acetylmuramyl-(pentapeptide) pyrophosphoryl-undecaprenol N-acetylglucosamine transferase